MDHFTPFELFSLEAAKTLAFQLKKKVPVLFHLLKAQKNLEDTNQIVQPFLPTKDGMAANTMGSGELDGDVQIKKPWLRNSPNMTEMLNQTKVEFSTAV